MMAIASIQFWLSQQNRTYSVGIALLLKYEPNNKLLPYFAKNQNSVYVRKLYDELNRINSIPDPELQLISKKITQHEDSLPVPFRKEYTQVVSLLFENRRSLNRSLNKTNTKNTNKAISDQLHETQTAINNFYDRVRTFNESGQFIRGDKSVFQEYLDCMRSIKYLREQASRNRKNAEALSHIIKEKTIAHKLSETLAKKLHDIT